MAFIANLEQVYDYSSWISSVNSVLPHYVFDFSIIEFITSIDIWFIWLLSSLICMLK